MKTVQQDDIDGVLDSTGAQRKALGLCPKVERVYGGCEMARGRAIGTAISAACWFLIGALVVWLAGKGI